MLSGSVLPPGGPFRHLLRRSLERARYGAVGPRLPMDWDGEADPDEGQFVGQV